MLGRPADCTCVCCSCRCCAQGAAKLQQKLHSLGYRCSSEGFQGPWISHSDIIAKRVVMKDVNLFCVKERNMAPPPGM